MIRAVCAFPLLCAAQLAPRLQHYMDPTIGGTIPTGRAIYVIALGLYVAWLAAEERIPARMHQVMTACVCLSVAALFMPRIGSVPILWLLQASILVALLMWVNALRQRTDEDRGLMLFLVGVTAAAHAVGTLTIYPLCQIGADPEMLALPRAAYVCEVVIE